MKLEISLSGNDINFSFDFIEKATNLRYLTIYSMDLQSLEGLDTASVLFFLHANSNNFDIPNWIFINLTMELKDT